MSTKTKTAPMYAKFIGNTLVGNLWAKRIDARTAYGWMADIRKVEVTYTFPARPKRKSAAANTGDGK